MLSHLSQVAAKRKLDLHNVRVKVTGHFHEQGSVLRGDAEGFCDGFDVDIVIESDEPANVIAGLMRLADQMCFTGKALEGKTPFIKRVTLNQIRVELD